MKKFIIILIFIFCSFVAFSYFYPSLIHDFITFRVLKEKVARGDIENQYHLAQCYIRGVGVRRDYNQGIRLLQKAADNGDLKALYYLGYIYERGIGVARNFEESFRLWHLAALKGHSIAQYNLGIYYSQGIGVEKEHNEAFKWFKKAADQGLINAQFNLGFCYLKGEGVKQNFEESSKWLKNAAARKHVDAIYALGELCKIQQEYSKAQTWYNEAIKLGHSKAEIALNNIKDDIAKEKEQIYLALLEEEKRRKENEIRIAQEQQLYSPSSSSSSGTPWYKDRENWKQIVYTSLEVLELGRKLYNRYHGLSDDGSPMKMGAGRKLQPYNKKTGHYE